MADGGLAILKGLRTDDFARNHWAAINDVLAHHGFERAGWHKYKDDEAAPVWVEMPVRRKDHHMTIRQSAAAVDQNLAKAAADAVGPSDGAINVTLQNVSALHPDAVKIAETEGLKLGDRTRALLPFIDAVDELVAAALAHPDQSAPLHGHVIKALHDMADIYDKVGQRERARIPPLPA